MVGDSELLKEEWTNKPFFKKTKALDLVRGVLTYLVQIIYVHSHRSIEPPKVLKPEI